MVIHGSCRTQESCARQVRPTIDQVLRRPWEKQTDYLLGSF